MTETPLDIAHAAMQASDDDAARLRFFERLADGELFLLLASEAQGDAITPEVFDVDEGRFVLIFDQEDRLAQFVGATAPYAALSGRGIAGMLAGQGIGMGVNLDVAPSSILIPADAVDWLHATLQNRPAIIDVRPTEIGAPKELPEAMLQALDAKLAAAAGLAHMAWLVSVTYAPARPGHLLAFVGATEGAETALASAVGEALIFSGIEAGEIDVGFFDPSDPITERFARTGLRFDLPAARQVAPQVTAPGMDPEKPPRLR